MNEKHNKVDVLFIPKEMINVALIPNTQANFQRASDFYNMSHVMRKPAFAYA